MQLFYFFGLIAVGHTVILLYETLPESKYRMVAGLLSESFCYT